MSAPTATRLCLLGGAAALLAVSGCGAELPGGIDGTAELPGADASETASATLSVAEDTAAGTVVTDDDGYTLYSYTGDSAEPSLSMCTGDCAEQWPPALVRGRASTEEIDHSLVGRLERADGATQLTLAGWPLYRFSGDVDPGDVNGQGANGTWFAMKPTGTRADALPHGRQTGTGGPKGYY
ncbi:hypothetical protein [Streptomonospora litoralis]|uniref:Lipoprotein n=1 Tax=Streptomonospora litoralis TaxID=2498135 RepID=A0A4P6Q9U4_9ACTN|nr:hypothetical protein [Streptomonospora litoralis]QBI55897.1 hypothetical protein EKD16_20690 [Streptomonospora litoralis]